MFKKRKTRPYEYLNGIILRIWALIETCSNCCRFSVRVFLRRRQSVGVRAGKRRCNCSSGVLMASVMSSPVSSKSKLTSIKQAARAASQSESLRETKRNQEIEMRLGLLGCFKIQTKITYHIWVLHIAKVGSFPSPVHLT